MGTVPATSLQASGDCKALVAAKAQAGPRRQEHHGASDQEPVPRGRRSSPDQPGVSEQPAVLVSPARQRPMSRRAPQCGSSQVLLTHEPLRPRIIEKRKKK